MEFQEIKPIYLQIADKIMDDILAGRYTEQERLPSVREYAMSVEVNANTVMRTYDYLSQQQLIFNRRGIGFFVETGAKERILDLRRAKFFASEADYFFGRLASFDVSADDLHRMYSAYLDSHNQSK